jgi:hypothetical protein
MAKDIRSQIISEKDKEFIDQAYSDYESAKAKKPIDKWQKYDRYVEDDQYSTPDAKDEWKPRPQVNICWASIRTIHANMTGGKTSINITCKRPMYEDITQDLNDVISSYWEELDMDMKVSEGEWIRPKLGSVAYKTTWNPSKNDGRGDLDCEVVHPANVFIDPNITNPWHVQRGEFVDFVKPVSMRYVLNKYSKESDPLCKFKKKELMDILVPEANTADTEIYGDLTEQSSRRIPTTVKGAGSTQSFNMRDTVNLHEYWYRNENNKLQVAWIAGQVILKKSEDDQEMKQNGFYKHGKYPLVYIPYIQKDKRLDGRSELQSLVGQSSKRDGIQDIINILIQDYLVSEKLTGQPQKAYRHGAVKNPEKLTAEAGLLIPTKGVPSQDIYVFEGKTMIENLNVVEGMLTHADRITGQWDITQGRNSPAIKTLGQTSLLMEQAMKPQNDKVNTLNYGLRELVELWIDHLSEFVTEDREYIREKTIHVQNPDGSISQKTEMEPFMFNPSLLLNAPDRMQDEQGNIKNRMQTDEMGIEEPITRQLYFKVNIDIGATLAMTKAYMMEIAFQLWAQKLIDIEGVYKLLPEFPGKAEALERMKQQATQPITEGDFMPEQIEQFIQGLPEEILQILDSMPEEERYTHIMAMMQMPPEQIEGHIQQMMGGVQNEPVPAM